MEQNPNADLTPEELDALSSKLIEKWTLEEQEEFFSSQDAITGLLGGGVATNWNPSESLPPITLSGLQETYANVEESLFRGIHITSIVPPEQGWIIAAHCSICRKTFFVLSPYAKKPDDGDYLLLKGTCLDEELNVKHNLYAQFDFDKPYQMGPRPEEWTTEAYKHYWNPLGVPSMIEIVQEMSIDEAKKRWPNTPIQGEENK